VITVLVYVIMVIIMFGLGCTMNWEEVRAVMKYKRALVVGVLSQYGFMPLIGWCLSRIFELNTSTALGAIIFCSAPGGTLSNFFCYHTDGNLGLSIAMTCFSTLAAFGMMPLMIWLWADEVNGFKDGVDIGKWDMDYWGLVFTLVTIIAPSLLGIFTRSTEWGRAETDGYFCRKTRKERWQWFSFISSVTGALFIILAIVMGFEKYHEYLLKEWRVAIAGGLIVPFGSTFGYVVAKLCGLAHKEAMTVSWETGLQNMGLSIAIIEISFEDGGNPDKMEILMVPFHAVMFYYFEVGIMFMLFKSLNRQYRLKEEVEKNEKTDVEINL